ncbi:hypothetical protein CVV65_11895 [Kyrpidia spormannii]|uniref:PucR C-terminal helix-turn-helix domain-containing protein n=1 Tax=Kyrpidia spormannii TaxID=2055160 RepID=A0A2K8N860_9BACL|nr:helix-turn-helix domain-containing protein [Kyrpidia spormannii]ATY85539.1 hypothetical protein CVV65_11895 [Kyrpidia spormannii]
MPIRGAGDWVRTLLQGGDDPEGRGWEIGLIECHGVPPEGWSQVVLAMADGRRGAWAAVEGARVWAARKTEIGSRGNEDKDQRGRAIQPWLEWVDNLEAELLVPFSVGVGRLTEGWLDWPLRRREAEEALGLGRVLHPGRRVYRYEDLAWERFLAALPRTEALRYSRGVLKDALQQYAFIEETVRAMVEHHLNISEAARALFVHRNTLMYRLDRIQECTGLDPRRFDGALQLYTALVLHRFGQVAQSPL